MAAAAALLPPLLPTPPRSEMLPILPTPPRSKMMPLLPTPLCGGLTVLPASPSNSKPGRADSVERWDAHKKYKKPCSPSSSLSDSSGSPGRADSVERWDSNKIKTPTSSSNTSSSSSSREISESPRRAASSSSSCETGDGNSKRPPSRASTAERWDTHKKPRSAQLADDAESRRTGEQNDGTTAAPTMIETVAAAHVPICAGASFLASPEPSMLPMPTFLLAH